MRFLTVAAIGALMSSALAAAPAPQNPEKVTLIVKMAKGLTIAQAQAVVRGHGATPKAPIAKLDLQIIEVPANVADAVAKALKADAQIVRVEADHIRQWQSTPSDTLSDAVGAAENFLGPGLTARPTRDTSRKSPS